MLGITKCIDSQKSIYTRRQGEKVKMIFPLENVANSNDYREF